MRRLEVRERGRERELEELEELLLNNFLKTKIEIMALREVFNENN